MLPVPYQSPAPGKDGFNCPFCNAFSEQQWSDLFIQVRNGLIAIQEHQAAFCGRCRKPSIWIQRRLVYPVASAAPKPNPDLPVEVLKDYQEASSILAGSARGAAALLRLAIQKLCVDLGGQGKDLNTDIGELVKKGLPTKIQQALDIVRVIGNESVHPGTIDLRDDPVLAIKLFHLVNMIAEAMITQPKEVEALFGTLPEGS